MQHLGVELVELDDWNCCGATAYMAVDEAKACVLAARNLALAEKSGHAQLLAPCAACYLVLNKTKHYFHDYPAMKQTMDRALAAVGLRYGGDTAVRHPLDVLLNDVGLDAIRQKVVRPLKGLKVAPYYGCQIVRPYATFDDQYNPTAIDRLMEALGATVVRYPLKTKCCGGSLTGTLPVAGIRMVYILLNEARKRGPTAWPRCARCASSISTPTTRRSPSQYGPVRVPTVYFTQLMGLAFGLPEEQLGLNRAAVRLEWRPAAAPPRRARPRLRPMDAPQTDIRIGFYVCHCGHNIASMVDCPEVARYAGTLPGVVLSRDYKYMCSDPGQELIRRDIAEFRLNRIVVASCSPLLHERTFRSATAAGGLNPFCFHMVNIREHDSWVHTDRRLATEKAKALARAGIRRVAFHQALEPKRVPIHPDVLVVGGGIAGIHAALTLAEAGRKVVLVEREPSIGGHMAKFDKTFPTLDCAACILTPKMSAVRAHRNITLWSYSEVVKTDGYVGNYTVTVRRKPRYVSEELCVGCQECIDSCVYKKPMFPDEFNEGLGKRKPIHIPFPQATPQVVLIDPEVCLNFKRGVLTDKCKKTCVEACAERKAIDFNQKEEIREIKVGAIIVATGFQTFDVKRLPQYGYGAYPNVYTALEVERLVNASGPTSGDVVLRDGRHPKAIGIIHCVGSRDKKTNRWCSRVCCMYSMKLAHLLKEHSGAEIYNFYIDIRAPGKGYEEFYDKLNEEGVHFIRGRVGEVTDWAMTPDEEGKLVIRVGGHPGRLRPPDPGRHGGPGDRDRAPGRFPGGPPAVQHELRHGGLLPGAAPEARPGQHLHGRDLHRRVLPGAPGHSRHGRPGRGGGGRGAGPDRPGLHRPGAEHCADPAGLQRVQVLRAALPLHGDLVRRGHGEGRHQRGSLQGLRHVRGILPVGFHCAEPVRGRRGVRRNPGGAGPWTHLRGRLPRRRRRRPPNRGLRASSRSSATGARTPRPTSPGCRACGTPPT